MWERFVVEDALMGSMYGLAILRDRLGAGRRFLLAGRDAVSEAADG